MSLMSGHHDHGVGVVGHIEGASGNQPICIGTQVMFQCCVWHGLPSLAAFQTRDECCSAKRVKAWCQSEDIDMEGQCRPRATLNKSAIKTAWPLAYVRGIVVPVLSDLVGRYAFMA